MPDAAFSETTGVKPPSLLCFPLLGQYYLGWNLEISFSFFLLSYFWFLQDKWIVGVRGISYIGYDYSEAYWLGIFALSSLLITTEV